MLATIYFSSSQEILYQKPHCATVTPCWIIHTIDGGSRDMLPHF